MKDTLLVILKFIVAVLLLPVVVASTVALQNEILEFDAALQQSILVGVVSYCVLYFFVYDFSHIYAFGQRVVAVCFGFLKPLVQVAPYAIPVYTVVLLIMFSVVRALGWVRGWDGAFLPLIAASVAMHLVLTARELYTRDSSPGKPAYFFQMALIYVFDVFLVALMMHMTLPGFSFPRFFEKLAGESFHMYKAVFLQLF